MNKGTFLFCGTNNLEQAVAMKILQNLNNGQANVSDAWQLLSYGGDDEVDHTLRVLAESGDVYLMPGFPTGRIKDFLGKFIQLSADNIWGNISALSQVCAIIGHDLTPYEELVCAFAEGYIPGLRAAGATESQMKYLALRDRLLRGGSIPLETAAAKSEIIHIRSSRDDDPPLTGRLAIFPNELWPSIVRSWGPYCYAVLDNTLITDPAISCSGISEPLYQLIADGRDSVTNVTLFSSDLTFANSARIAWWDDGYDVRDGGIDPRTKLSCAKATLLPSHSQGLSAERLAHKLFAVIGITHD